MCVQICVCINMHIYMYIYVLCAYMCVYMYAYTGLFRYIYHRIHPHLIWAQCNRLLQIAKSPFLAGVRLLPPQHDPHSQVWNVSFICVTWCIHTCDTTHPTPQHQNQTSTNESCYTFKWYVTNMKESCHKIWMSNTTHMNETPQHQHLTSAILFLARVGLPPLQRDPLIIVRRWDIREVKDPSVTAGYNPLQLELSPPLHPSFLFDPSLLPKLLQNCLKILYMSLIGLFLYVYIHVCVYTYMYAYVYVRIHTRICIYMGMCIHTYTYIHTHMYIWACIFMYIYSYIYKFIHIYIYIYRYMYVYTNLYIYIYYIYIYINTYLNTYIHTYMNIYIHTYTNIFICIYMYI